MRSVAITSPECARVDREFFRRRKRHGFALFGAIGRRLTEATLKVFSLDVLIVVHLHYRDRW